MYGSGHEQMNRRKAMFHDTSTHFIHGKIARDKLAGKNILNAPSHRQDSIIYHGFG